MSTISFCSSELWDSFTNALNFTVNLYAKDEKISQSFCFIVILAIAEGVNAFCEEHKLHDNNQNVIEGFDYCFQNFQSLLKKPISSQNIRILAIIKKLVAKQKSNPEDWRVFLENILSEVKTEYLQKDLLNNLEDIPQLECESLNDYVYRYMISS